LSSAILYVAIVAIWACVLIPRWLRRDSSAAVPSSPADAQAGDDVPGGADEEPAPPPRYPEEAEAVSERRSAPGESRDVPDDRGHRRVLSSRRRLLLLLVALTAASGALAGTRLAAWWVIVPPSAMLIAYLVLLRAAGQADAEWRELARARARAARAAAPAAAGTPPAAAVRAEVVTFSGSRAPEGLDDKEIYDQYADAKLRAVGD